MSSSHDGTQQNKFWMFARGNNKSSMLKKGFGLKDFWNLALHSGQLKATHDIFKILDQEGKTPEELIVEIGKYFDDVSEKWRRDNFMFAMHGKQVTVNSDDTLNFPENFHEEWK